MGQMTWPAMVWIGGAPGAGKSTIARDLARRTDLPLHPIDLWTYDHVGRMPPLRPLAQDLAEGPEFAAEAFVKIARTRLELVAADVRARGLGDVPALVEGPQLFPSMADEVGTARSGSADGLLTVLGLSLVAVLQFHVRFEAPAEM